MPEGQGEMPPEEREMEPEEFNSEEEALLHFSNLTEARAVLPWDQRTFKEKVLYYVDRIFLVFLGFCLLVIVAEAAYKTWYVTNLERISALFWDTVSYLFTQEEREQFIEL